jgi:hypothetical protein
MGHTVVSMKRDQATGATNLRRRRRLLKQQEVAEESSFGGATFGKIRFRGSTSLRRGFVGDAVRDTVGKKSVGKMEKSDIDVDRSGDLFAIDGPQEVKLVDPSSMPDLVQRPTSDSDDFMFLWGGMSEKGLGSSASGFGMGIEK